jgi:putative ABC transport system permease protein
MGEDYTAAAIELSPLDLTIAAGLVLVAGGVSMLLRLHLERRLALAAVRTVIQLLLIGYVLRWVFDIENVWLILAVALLMIAAAGHASVQRSSRTLTGVIWRAWGTLLVSGLLTSVIVTGVIIGAEPWYQPQYLVPLLGMVLGNSLTGISLTMDSLLQRLDERRDEVEMLLAHGATRWEAARDSLAEAVRRGMIPIINAMMVVGIVSLPGMMTGQILAGADPVEAVKYQVVVMFMIAGATSTGCIIMVLLLYRRLFTAHHQLDWTAIRQKKS